MEEACKSEGEGHSPENVLFGEEFAYVAITATIAYTYAIVNAISYIA